MLYYILPKNVYTMFVNQFIMWYLPAGMIYDHVETLVLATLVIFLTIRKRA